MLNYTVHCLLTTITLCFLSIQVFKGVKWLLRAGKLRSRWLHAAVKCRSTSHVRKLPHNYPYIPHMAKTYRSFLVSVTDVMLEGFCS
jgi:hypothetical protein